ncbi:MAG: hypothetical protein LBF41_03100 [Deltaproteobacteria bacterium]|jgi:(2Fe-2S) ferredoxin|nr:hypothetical protein [Deltaproteobacteria bacterium]
MLRVKKIVQLFHSGQIRIHEFFGVIDSRFLQLVSDFHQDIVKGIFSPEACQKVGANVIEKCEKSVGPKGGNLVIVPTGVIFAQVSLELALQIIQSLDPDGRLLARGSVHALVSSPEWFEYSPLECQSALFAGPKARTSLKFQTRAKNKKLLKTPIVSVSKKGIISPVAGYFQIVREVFLF